jgi:hypothetical protein
VVRKVVFSGFVFECNKYAWKSIWGYGHYFFGEKGKVRDAFFGERAQDLLSKKGVYRLKGQGNGKLDYKNSVFGKFFKITCV